MLTGNVIIGVERACEPMNDDGEANDPGDKSADIKAALIPVGAGRMAVIERGDVHIAFTDDKVVHTVRLR